MRELLKLREAARFLPFWTLRTIQSYTAQGKIPCLKIGRQVFYEEEKLKSFASDIIKEQPGNYGECRSRKDMGKNSSKGEPL